MSARNSLKAKSARRAKRTDRHASAPTPFGRYGTCRCCTKYRVVFTAPICRPCAERLAEALSHLAGWRDTFTLRAR